MEDLYKTDDLLTSSFLLSKQAKLLDISQDRPRHFIFVFEGLNKCEELVRAYINNASAPARELFARREELITAMRHRNEKSYGNNSK